MATFTDNARRVLEHRYLARDVHGRIVETPDGMLARVASALAAPDAIYGGDVPATEARFLARLETLELLPASPTLMNAGQAHGQLAACFVVPVGDSLPEIFDAVKWAAAIQTTGGGTGFAFSRLRASGEAVASMGAAASGPLPFIDVFDQATVAIRQGGRRRGANMGVLRVDHPDVLAFATAKLDPRRWTNFNVSVGLTDEFIRAARARGTYALRSPRTGEVVRQLDAHKVLSLLAKVAWASGDPGVLFLDRIEAAQPTPSQGRIEATNPCGEQPLLPFESCVLASINVARFVAPGAQDLAWDALTGAIHDGVHLLDNVIDASRYPLEQITAITRANRKIGLGIMGLADLFVELGIPYGSAEALALGERIAAHLGREARAASVALAVRRGAFPSFASSRWAADGHVPLRNATTTTVAPTGTISLLAGCSSGIEPLYAVAVQRRALDGQILTELHPGFVRRGRAGGWLTPEVEAEVVRAGRARGVRGIPEDVQALFPTALELAPEVHVRMQAAFQRHVDAAVSKTVNLPHDATADDVERIILLADELGCKGVTVYRDRSRAEQVLEAGITPPAAPVAARKGCPECGGPLVREGRCEACPRCAWAACG